MAFPQSIPMLMDPVLQQVEDEVTTVSLRHQFGFLSSERVRQIYFNLLMHVHAEYAAYTDPQRRGVVDPIVFVAIRKEDVDGGFEKVPQIFGRDLDQACGLVSQVQKEAAANLRARPVAEGKFRVIVMLDFDPKFYVLEIPVPPIVR